MHELSDWERWPFKLAVTLTLITHDSELITVSCVNFILWSYSHLHIVHYCTTLIHFALMIVCFKYFYVISIVFVLTGCTVVVKRLLGMALLSFLLILQL